MSQGGGQNFIFYLCRSPAPKLALVIRKHVVLRYRYYGNYKYLASLIRIERG